MKLAGKIRSELSAAFKKADLGHWENFAAESNKKASEDEERMKAQKAFEQQMLEQ